MNKCLSARDRGCLSGRIENRVRITDGTATVWREALHLTKVGHWDFPEKAVQRRRFPSQETCSDLCSAGPASTAPGDLYAEKRLRQTFLVRRSRSQLPLLPSPLWQIALWIAPQKNTLTGGVFIRTGQGFFLILMKIRKFPYRFSRGIFSWDASCFRYSRCAWGEWNMV